MNGATKILRKDDYELNDDLVLFVSFDVSGSMSKNSEINNLSRLEFVKSEITTLVEEFHEKEIISHIGLQSFDTNQYLHLPVKSVDNGVPEFLSCIRSLKPLGSTAIYDSVIAGNNHLKEAFNNFKLNNAIHLLLTDGEDNSSSKDAMNNCKDITSLFNSSGGKIKQIVISLGKSNNVAENIGAISVSGDFSNLPGIFKKIIEDITQFKRILIQDNYEKVEHKMQNLEGNFKKMKGNELSEEERLTIVKKKVDFQYQQLLNSLELRDYDMEKLKEIKKKTDDLQQIVSSNEFVDTSLYKNDYLNQVEQYKIQMKRVKDSFEDFKQQKTQYETLESIIQGKYNLISELQSTINEGEKILGDLNLVMKETKELLNEKNFDWKKIKKLMGEVEILFSSCQTIVSKGNELLISLKK
jgi:hypothetical protein